MFSISANSVSVPEQSSTDLYYSSHLYSATVPEIERTSRNNFIRWNGHLYGQSWKLAAEWHFYAYHRLHSSKSQLEAKSGIRERRGEGNRIQAGYLTKIMAARLEKHSRKLSAFLGRRRRSVLGNSENVAEIILIKLSGCFNVSQF